MHVLPNCVGTLPVKKGCRAKLSARRGTSHPSQKKFSRASPLWIGGDQEAASAAQSYTSKAEPTRKKAVVVGGGWAGFGACYNLQKQGFEVTLLDAAENPGGLSSGWRTAQGRAVEAGIKGFWYHYSNIYRLVDELGLAPSDVFTDWTQSAFWSPEGIQVESPVLQDLPRLPAPLGSLVYTSPYFSNLPLADRLSAVPLVGPLLDYRSSPEVYAEYDRMSAGDLFRKYGVSERLYEEFLAPLLLVLMFAPPDQLSAAVALDVLYNYAIAHQADFDVRWCRGSVADRLFAPWQQAIEEKGGRILGGRRVQEVCVEQGAVYSAVQRVRASTSTGQTEEYEADVVVLAVGVNAMKAIARGSAALAQCPQVAAMAGLQTVAVLAVRLWLDRRVPLANASNVGAGFADRDVGFTFYDLNQLQDEYRAEPDSVVEVDFYNAESLLGLTDEEMVARAKDEYLGQCVAAFRDAAVLDSSVLRFPAAVTHFAPGCTALLPSTRTSVRGLYLAADWVAQGPGVPFGARGLSQEKALVCGQLAADAAAQDLGAGLGAAPAAYPAEPDEPHIAAGMAAAKAVRDFGKLLGVEPGYGSR